jgi:hypothetical protein
MRCEPTASAYLHKERATHPPQAGALQAGEDMSKSAFFAARKIIVFQ